MKSMSQEIRWLLLLALAVPVIFYVIFGAILSPWVLHYIFMGSAPVAVAVAGAGAIAPLFLYSVGFIRRNRARS